jgi:hypothetical protein
MMIFSAHNTFLYSAEKGGERAKQWRDREREGERDRVLQQKVYGMGNKLDCLDKHLCQLEKG